MVVYELKCLTTSKSYIGKTQRTLKIRTKEHIYDTWKIISSGGKKLGKNRFGSGGYAGADAFSKHFGNLCRTCSSGNQMRQRLKKIMIPTILWQGEGIRCMKSARTLQCKICMVERKKILSQFRTNRSKIMNDNSNIYSSCKCGAKFHKFIRPDTENTDEALAAEKSHNPVRYA